MSSVDVMEFFEFLNKKGGIHPVWKNMLYFIKEHIGDGSADVLIVLCIYFSLLDDGNTCICLDEKTLLDKWNKKWQRLFCDDEGRAGEFCISTFTPDIKGGYSQALSSGISKILSCENDSVIKSLFVIKESSRDKKKWLFAKKYFNAICTINERLDGNILDDVSSKISDKELAGIESKFKSYTGIGLNREQCACIYNGSVGKNFIITGGPGTGKTTVVTYMLWDVFANNEEYLDWDLKFAAPSGKASKRIKESIIDELNKFFVNPLADDEKKVFKDKSLETDKDKYMRIYKKLTTAEPLTIHKLLGIGYDGHFRYNSDSRFPDKTILIIDEASMIDICLFSSIFKAIPDVAKGVGNAGRFRLFILGDEKQLPSVDSGAVLGNILSHKKEKVVALIESNRFKDYSIVGRFAKKIQSESPDFVVADGAFAELGDLGKCDYIRVCDCDKFKSFFSGSCGNEKYPVITYFPQEASGKELRDIVRAVVEEWACTYYKDISRNDFKKFSIEAQILCAEKQGIFGCDSINDIVQDYVKKENNIASCEKFYPGQKVIITENISSLGLSNGDTGIVVVDKAGGSGALKIKFDNREEPEPVSNIPIKSIQTSYAITIHKSQGSGFENILIFLPRKEGNPLLTRQILYTAVTRTKARTFIFASDSTIKAACANNQERDTGL